MTDLIAELADVPVVAYAWRKEGMKGWALGHSPPTPNMADFGKYEVRELTFRTHHAEIEAMARDAERYRFIRSSDADADQPYVARHGQTDWGKFYDQWLMEDDADNAIDAAMHDSAREGE